MPTEPLRLVLQVWQSRGQSGYSGGKVDRGPFIDHIVEIHREITRLQVWLADSRRIADQRRGSAYSRMIDWVQAKLDMLIASIEPEGIERQLNENKLFPHPEGDELYDPLGDPGEKYYWQIE